MIDLQSILDHISVHSLLECHSHTLIMFGYTMTFLNKKLNSTMHNHYIFTIIQHHALLIGYGPCQCWDSKRVDTPTNIIPVRSILSHFILLTISFHYRRHAFHI
jgi:hypothetical protein